MRPDAVAATPFCTNCGRPKVEGRCPWCEPLVAAPMQQAKPSRLPRVLAAAVAGLLALALVGGLVVTAVQTSALRDDVDDLGQDLEAQSVAAGRAASRLAELEAELHNQPKPAEVARRVQASVFLVEAGDATGSAWVVSSEGGTSKLITNYHVVSERWLDDKRGVEIKKDDKTWPATIEKVSEGSDLALVSVAENFTALARSTAEPAVGDSVLAVGSPLGLEGTVSTGVVSALRVEEGDRFIQFSAPVSPGSSGGPLVDQKGDVIGVTVFKAVLEGAEGLGFAVPVARVCESLISCT